MVARSSVVSKTKVWQHGAEGRERGQKTEDRRQKTRAVTHMLQSECAKSSGTSAALEAVPLRFGHSGIRHGQSRNSPGSTGGGSGVGSMEQ